MSNYDKGRRFEYRVQKDLKEQGYETIRAASSKGAADLAAFKFNQALFVQCKNDDSEDNGIIPPAERRKLLHLAALIGGVPLVAWKHKGKSAIHYSQLTGPAPDQRLPWHPDIVHVDGIPPHPRRA